MANISLEKTGKHIPEQSETEQIQLQITEILWPILMLFCDIMIQSVCMCFTPGKRRFPRPLVKRHIANILIKENMNFWSSAMILCV